MIVWPLDAVSAGSTISKLVHRARFRPRCRYESVRNARRNSNHVSGMRSSVHVPATNVRDTSLDGSPGFSLRVGSAEPRWTIDDRTLGTALISASLLIVGSTDRRNVQLCLLIGYVVDARSQSPWIAEATRCTAPTSARSQHVDMRSTGSRWQNYRSCFNSMRPVLSVQPMLGARRVRRWTMITRQVLSAGSFAPTAIRDSDDSWMTPTVSAQRLSTSNGLGSGILASISSYRNEVK